LVSKEFLSVRVAITCRHGSIGDDVRDLITSRSEKLLTYFERVTSIAVTVDFEKDRVNVELLVDAEHRHNFVSRDIGEDVLSTFDGALQKMEQQIRKYKEKLQDHRRDRPANEVFLSEPEPEAEESE
jgi:putative sigma-54 modulation protein